jgi:hypothetical protein
MLVAALYAAALVTLYPSAALAQYLLGVGMCIQQTSNEILTRELGVGDVTGPVTEVRESNLGRCPCRLGRTDWCRRL